MPAFIDRFLQLICKLWCTNTSEHQSELCLPHQKYNAYIGRFQSPHLGHRWLLDQHLDKNEPVLILIRDVEIDEKNPFTAQEVKSMLETLLNKK